MLTKDITAELHSIMQQLQEQGKEPTVALIKARLSTPVPIPALIATLKSWKSTNRVPKVEIEEKELTDRDRINELEKQLSELQKRLAILEKKLG